MQTDIMETEIGDDKRGGRHTERGKGRDRDKSSSLSRTTWYPMGYISFSVAFSLLIFKRWLPIALP